MSLSIYVAVVVVSLMVSSVKSQFALLSVSGDDQVEIYHNGRYEGGTGRWNETKQILIKAEEGDVIGVVVTDLGGGYGAIAELDFNGVNCITKVNSGSWRAQNISGALPALWLRKSFNMRARSWSKPTSSNLTPSRPGIGFPYWTGAEYVWATGAGVRDKILLRLEVSKGCTI